MLRVSTLYASSAATTAAYYTQYLADAPGEIPGVWLGAQADALGLIGTVDADALALLLAGRDPATGRTLGRSLTDRTTGDGRIIRAVAGFDATLSAPKSLSVWWALTGDSGLLACHDTAVHAVLDELERVGATTRIRADGARLHVDTGGLIAAAFRQTTSRLDDPQIHTHLVISGKVRTTDGAWRALDARILKQHQRSFGGLYQSVLRAELTARYGIAFGEIVNGQAEIAGIPDTALAVFSKRAAQVEATTRDRVAEFRRREGREPSRFERAAIEREAAADTRGKKTGNDPNLLRAQWRTEAAAAHLTPTSLTAAIRDAATTQPPQRLTIHDVIADLSTQRSTWHDLDILRALTDRLHPRPGIDGTRWHQSLRHAVAAITDACIPLDPDTATTQTRRSDGRSVWIEPIATRWSSQAVIDQELDLLVWTLAAQPDPPTPSATVQRGDLDLVQAGAAADIAGHDDLVVIIGPAGTGKTTMLAAAVADLSHQRRPVRGLAPTAKAAQVLAAETAMRCDTIAKLLHEHDRPHGPHPDQRLVPGTTVIIDEAGMVSTPDLWRVTDLARRHHLRIVLVGDPYQLHAVGRGGMLAEIAATARRTTELEHVHRFSHRWEANASLRLRHGDPAVLDTYLHHGRIRAGTLDDHLEHITQRWLDLHTTGRTLAVTATTNDHAALINQHIQAARYTRGDLTGRPVTAADGAVFVGDTVMTRRNDRNLTTTAGDHVRNRERWTVSDTYPDGSITAHAHHGATVHLPVGYVTEHVQLGYATTEHGNQGITADEAFTLASAATTGRGLYVGMTRGRHDNTALVVTDTPDHDDAIDTLTHILANDRTDIPATVARRYLDEQNRRPTPRTDRRHREPTWLDDWRHHLALRHQHLSDELTRLTQRRPALEHAAADATRAHERALALPDADPHTLDRARRQMWDDQHAASIARSNLDTATWRTRPRLAHAHQRAAERASHSTTTYEQLAARAEPVEALRTEARNRLADAHRALDHHDRQRQRVIGEHLAVGDLLNATATWTRWAAGQPVTTDELRVAVTHLARHPDTGPLLDALGVSQRPQQRSRDLGAGIEL